MILRCYPNLLYFQDIPNLVSCAFSTIPIFPPFLLNNNAGIYMYTCTLPCVYTLLPVTVENRDYEPFSMEYYVDIDYAGDGRILQLCYDITIFRSMHCSNTTLSFWVWFEVSLFAESFIIISSPSRSQVFIEACGMYVMKTNDIISTL